MTDIIGELPLPEQKPETTRPKSAKTKLLERLVVGGTALNIFGGGMLAGIQLESGRVSKEVSRIIDTVSPFKKPSGKENQVAPIKVSKQTSPKQETSTPVKSIEN